MTSSQKFAFSLLITVSLFAALVVASFFGLFTFIDKNVYAPTKIAQLKNNLDSVSSAGDEYILNFLSEFGYEKGYMSSSDVSLYLNRNRSDGTAKKLSDLNGNLFYRNPGLKGIRIVDINGKSVHFSTFEKDLLKKDSSKNIVSYKNYDELLTPSDSKELSYEIIKANDFKKSDKTEYSLVFDSESNRLIFSYPLYYEDYPLIKASVLFYVDGGDFIREISKKKLISVNENVLLLSSKDGIPGGFALGIPNINQELFINEILNRWNDNSDFAKIFDSYDEENKKSYSLISSVGNYVKVVGVFENSIFVISNLVKITLLVCSFITIFLFVFILFNIKKDELLNIKKYVKRFQFEMLNEYFESEELRNSKTPLEHFSDNKDFVFGKIKKSLGKQAIKHRDELDSLLDKSWQEIISVLSESKSVNSNTKTVTSAKAVVDSNEIKKILEEFFAKGTINVHAVTSSVPNLVQGQNKIPEVEAVEELEEISDAEAVEELEEISDAEAVEELEEISDAEAVEELEEISDAETVEELEEISDAEVVEELEEISDAEAVEELEEISDAEAVEELEEISDAEAVEELEEISATEAVEELEEISADEFVDISSFDVEESTLQEIKIDFSEPLEVCIDDTIDSEEGDLSIVEDFIVEIPSLFSLRNLEEVPTIIEHEKQNVDFSIPSVESILCDETEVQLKNSLQNEETVMLNKITPREDFSSLKFINQSFCLTSFGANNDNVSEIYPDAIVEGEDGVFSISNKIGPSGFEIDEKFKQLVDSVIK